MQGLMSESMEFLLSCKISAIKPGIFLKFQELQGYFEVCYTSVLKLNFSN